MNERKDGSDDRLAEAGMAIVLSAFVLAATGYNVVVPVFEAPDEHTHYFVVQYIAEHGSLPVQSKDPEERGPWEQEGSQPPLYYVVVSPIVALTAAHLEESELWYNHQNTMGHPALRGNENRFVHDPAEEGWPWRGYVLAVRAIRGISTLFCAAAVWCVFLLARRVVPGRSWLAVAAAGLVAFNPQFLHVSSAVSNDSAVILLATASLALLARLADGHDDAPTIAALALAAGLAPLAKLSGLAILGLVLLTLCVLAWQRRDYRYLARTAGPVVLLAAVLSGWWYVRNLGLYGSVTGIEYMLPEPMRRSFRLGEWLRGLPAELRGAWLSSWGIFGWFTVALPSVVYWLITAGVALAVAGVAWTWHERAAWVRWPRVGWLVLWWCIVLASLLQWMTIAKGGHGRLLFPAIASLGIVIAIGWRRLVPSRLGDRWFAAISSGGMAALAIYALLYVVRPAYAMPTSIRPSELPEEADRAGVLFGEGLRLVALEHPDRIVEGELVPISLYWQLDESVERDGYVALRFDQPIVTPDTGAVELVAGEAQLSYPGSGTAPPALLEPGPWLYVDRRLVEAPRLESVPVQLPAFVAGTEAGSEDVSARAVRMPVLARLSVHLYEPSTCSSWPALSADGGRQVPDFEARLVLEPSPSSRPAYARSIETAIADRLPAATYAESLELHVGSAAPGTASDVVSAAAPEGTEGLFLGERSGEHPPVLLVRGCAGEQMSIPVVWRVLQPTDADLAVFVHLTDGSGRVVAQSDSSPACHGDYPTSVWRRGELVVSEIAWVNPEKATAGDTYTLLVGLYRRMEGTPRIDAAGPDGLALADNALPLAQVTIE